MTKNQYDITEIKQRLDKPVVLIGMMGAGKTTLGLLLAKELQWPFYDTDDEIVRAAGKSIAQIFSEDGEPTFRELEKQTIAGLLRTGPCIIASGGGAITVPEIAKAVLEQSLCVWLDAPVDVLVERTKGSNRPLLQHSDPLEVLTTLSEKRQVAYQQAHIHVQDMGLTPEEAAQRILLQLREYIFMHSSDQEEAKHIPQTLCLDVSLFDRSYPIYIGSNLLAKTDVWLNQEFTGRKAFVITDYNVRAAVTDKFVETLKPHMKSVAVMELAPGEQTKSFDRFEAVMEWLIDNGVNRDSLIFAVGGGVIGDLAGFAASTILRGIDFIQIPTTLLSQVDSSVGGKTGINSRNAKNMVGAFYQPRTVVIDLDALATLPPREWRAGYAEIVKYGLLEDIHFLNWLIENGHKVMAGDPLATLRAIEVSCHMKAEIVHEDEREQSGRRALLNLGHTFAHAIEGVCHYDGSILHGEAVGIGLVLAARLSHRLGYLEAEDVSIIKGHLQSVGLPTEITDVPLPQGTTVKHLLDIMKADKKATKDGLVFIVLRHLGHAEVQGGISESLITEILAESMSAPKASAA